MERNGNGNGNGLDLNSIHSKLQLRALYKVNCQATWSLSLILKGGNESVSTLPSTITTTAIDSFYLILNADSGQAIPTIQAR